jgi:hypothetical protein
VIIPPALRRNVTAVWGEPGARWLAALPGSPARHVLALVALPYT